MAKEALDHGTLLVLESGELGEWNQILGWPAPNSFEPRGEKTCEDASYCLTE